MRFIAQRQIRDAADPGDDPAAQPESFPIYVYGTVVKVSVVDEPLHRLHLGACICEACRSSHLGESAEWFL